MKIFVAALLLCASVASAQTLTSADCVDCHKDPAMGDKHVDAAKFSGSAHAPIECTGCHADVKAFPHDPAPARPDCAQCHAAAVKDYATSGHAAARAKGVKD